jgi:hypothetical protein
MREAAVLQRAERQREFAAALLDPALPIPAGLVGPDRQPSAVRFAVYRNNVFAGLIDALQESFPATARIVGEDFFRAMAREYVRLSPPQSPILLDYGARFAAHIEAFEPARELPYLADVVRIERAWLEAYHAAEANSLGTTHFVTRDSAALPHLCLQLHPSLRVVRSRLPALSIWRMNVPGGEPAPIDLESGGEDALIVRPAADVEVRSLPAGGAEFIASLASGASVLDAATAAWAAHASFDLAANLGGLIGCGAIVGIDQPNTNRLPQAQGIS